LLKNDSDLAIDILLVFHSLHPRWKDGSQARLYPVHSHFTVGEILAEKRQFSEAPRKADC
jgi:hypothetical protein